MSVTITVLKTCKLRQLDAVLSPNERYEQWNVGCQRLRETVLILRKKKKAETKRDNEGREAHFCCALSQAQAAGRSTCRAE